MKTTFILVLFFLAFTAPVSWSQEKPDQDKDLSKIVTQLEKKVEMLEKRVKSLERRLQTSEQRWNKMLKNLPKFQRVPDDWKKFDYHGQTFYLVPLAEKEKKK